MPGRHGLLVGIDHYPFFPPKNQLASCVRDAQLVAHILEERFGFRPRDLHKLHDAEATRENMLTSLGELVQRAGPKDQVVFYFSGHGSYMIDDKRPSGRAETLVPHDSGRKTHEPSSENRDIRDDELYRWLLELSDVTPYVTVILDSCRAGSALRDEVAGAQRKSVPGETAPTRPSPRPLREVGSSSAFRDTGPSGWLPLSERYALLAACRAHEAAFVLDLPDGSKQSAFTFFLVRELMKLSGSSTYRDLGERVQPAVNAHFPHQTPQAEGARDRVLFGMETLVPQPYLQVHSQKGATVVLGGGAAHGVQVESRWELYPPGTRYAEESSSLGRLRIASVGSTEAEGNFTSEDMDASLLPDGCRAFEVERRLALPLPVVVQALETPSDQGHRALQKHLEASGLLRLDDPTHPTGPAWTVRPARNSSFPAWEILGTTGDPAVRPRPMDDPAAVVEVLESFAQRQYILALEPPIVAPHLRDALEVELLRRRPLTSAPNTDWHRAESEDGGPPTFQPGDELALRIYNRLEIPLHLHVLDLGLVGSVTLLHPQPGEHRPLAGPGMEEVGLQPGEELVVGVPDDFVGEDGLEWLKIFATTRETDLSFLTLTKTAPHSRALKSPLEKLLAAAWTHEGLREEIVQDAVSDSWTTTSVAFRVQHRLHQHSRDDYASENQS